jgi:hypothetical protein
MLAQYSFCTSSVGHAPAAQVEEAGHRGFLGSAYSIQKEPAMTHQDECPVLNDLTAPVIEHGPAAIASALATLMNHAMQIERD